MIILYMKIILKATLYAEQTHTEDCELITNDASEQITGRNQCHIGN